LSLHAVGLCILSLEFKGQIGHKI